MCPVIRWARCCVFFPQEILTTCVLHELPPFDDVAAAARVELLRLPGNLTEIFVTVLLEEHRSSAMKRFETAISDVPEVISCHAVAGGLDYIVRFFVKDIAHYQRVINALLEANIGIKEYCTYVVTQEVKDEHIYSEGVRNLAHTKDGDA